MRAFGLEDQACLLGPSGAQHQTFTPFAEEDIKRKQLKKAGEEYFASVLEKAAKVSTLSSSIAKTSRPLSSSDQTAQAGAAPCCKRNLPLPNAPRLDDAHLWFDPGPRLAPLQP